MTYMETAANAGDRSAMIYLAKAYESGNGLGTNRLVESVYTKMSISFRAK